MFGKRWYKDFAYRADRMVNGEWQKKWVGTIVAKDICDALKQLRKRFKNRDFGRLLVEETGNAVRR